MADNPYMTLAEQDVVSPAPAPAASGENTYMDLAKSDLEQTQQQIRGILDVVSPIDPNKAAEAVKLSRTSGLPEQTVHDNLEEVKRLERVRLLNLQRVMADSPVLARQLMDPNFAKLSQDNVENMSDIEMAASYLARSAGSGFLNLTGAFTKFVESVNPFTTSEEELAVLFKNDPAKLKDMRENGASGALSRWALEQQKLANQLMENAPEQVKQKYSNLKYFTTDSDEAAYLSPVKVIGDVVQSLPTTLALMYSMYVTKGAAGNTYSAMIEAGATREVALKEASRVAAEAMAKYSAVSEGAVGYAMQANQTRAEADKLSLEKLKSNPQYLELVDREGFSPEAARIYLSALASEQAGSMAGLVDAVTNFYGGRFLGRYISEGGALLPRAGKGFATEALTEAPQSIGEKIAENYAIQNNLDRSQSLTEGVAEAGAAGFFIGGLTGGGFSAALGGVQANDEAASNANTVFNLLNRINELAGADVVRQRDVQTFGAFMQAVQDEVGGDVNTLYIAPKTLIETLTAAGADIQQIVATVPSLANLQEQAANGTDIAIPVADFATHIAGSDYAQAIMPHLKADPTGMTKVEADEYMKNHGEQLKAEVEKVLAQQENKTEFKVSMDKVKADVKAQLDETQRFRSEVTDAYAQLMASFYAVTGAKIGLMPEEMAAKYPIKVASQGMATDQDYDQQGQLKTETANFKSWFKESKAVDGTGKPMVLYRGMSGESIPDQGVSVMKPTSGLLGTGIYMTGFTKRAEGYTKGENGQTYPLYASIQNPISEDEFVERFGRGKRSPEENQAITDQLMSEGYDGVIAQHGPDKAWEVVAFKPNQVKSVFNENPTDSDDILHQRGKEQPAGRTVPESVDKVANVESAFEFAATQSFPTNRDFKIAIQERVNAAAKDAKVNLEEFSKATEEYLVRVAMADGVTALRTNANAVGWYNEKVTKALRLVSLIHPEVSTDPQAKFAFVWAMAVTSNGLKVDKNFELAEQAYEKWKASGGKMPTDIGIGTAAGAINKSMGMYNALIEKHGFDVVEQFMTTMQTAGEVQKFTGQKISGENLTTQVYGAAALGPKIGNGFFMNLYGHFEQLTMDRWLMRTWGRWTGTLVEINQAQIKSKRSQLKDVIKALSPADKKAFEAIIKRKLTVSDIDEVGVAIWKASQKPANRVLMAKVGVFDEAGAAKIVEIMGEAKKGTDRVSYGDELRKVGNALTKYLDGQKEAPAGPPERGNIRKVFSRVLAELQKTYPALTMSDYQALLWYPEKRLYDAAKTADEATESYEDDEAPDYANAAAKLARAKGISDADIAGAIAAVDAELQASNGTAGVRSGARGSGDRGAGQEYNQDQPTFYSQLQRSVEQAKQAKAPASDWLAIIPKMAGVKAEEIEWTGLKDYLELLGKEQVTKEQILSYLAQNGVQIKEVSYGELTDRERFAEAQRIALDEYGVEYGELDGDDQTAVDESVEANNSQYGDYTLAGGKNYRELLLTLPPQMSQKDIERMMYLEAKRRRMSEPAQWVFDDDAEGQELQALKAKSKENVYRNRHWSEENVLAHIRFNERTDADGNKVLFIEELQSDWAQEGRKQGFGYQLMDNYSFVEQESGFYHLRQKGVDYPLGSGTMEEVKAKAIELGVFKNRMIPTAPFVTDTKGWLNLALKRMIRYAAENGFDKVAFVNGQQSAERYDLSKQISSIAYNPEEKILDAWDLNRRQVMRREITDESQLEDYVGKEVAKRLLEQPLVMGKHLLDGENIKVGGEGMIAFYDKIVPNAVSSLIKKMDGKIEGVTLADDAFDTAQGAADDALLADLGVDVQGTRPPQQLGFTVTDKMREMAMQGQPLFQGQQEPRGSFNPETNTITLLKAANLSTFLHEAGHFFLEVNADIAMQADAPAEMVQDMQKILDWFGVEDLQTWSAMTIDQKRPYHEQFARGFEAYLFEGKSPSVELQGIFQRFRSWLVNIYKQLAGLNVQLDDEIRGVFDRMLASSEAISQAEQARTFTPLFTSKPPFMTDEEWNAYQQSDVQSAQDAVQELETKSLKDMRWLSNAKSRLLKAMQRENAELRKEVRREVEAEVMAEPVYRAREFFKRGTLDGQPVENPVKLSIPEIEAMYEGNPIVGAIKSALGFGKYGMLGTENGMHPEQAAELFGFTSGDHLIRSLLEAPDPRGVIEQRTDSRMLERYGDINSPEALSRAADEAIHNDARARFVATEANALAKAVGKPKLVAQAAKAYAEQIINRLKIRDIKAGQYAASAARAGREAAQSKDLVEQATAKRNQLINTYATKAAYAAQDEVIKGVRYLQRFNGKNITKAVHIDSLEQIWTLLDRFDLRSFTSLKDIDRKRSLVEWVEMQRAKGEEPIVPQDLLNEAYRTSYKEMTLEDFRGLIETVQNIEHLGRLKTKLIKIQDQREFKAVSGEAAETIRENATGSIEDELESKGIKNAVASNGREVLAWHRKFASLIRQMDGFKDGGFLWSIFVKPMNEAGTQEASMREGATVKLGQLYKLLDGVKMNKKEFIPEIGKSLSYEGRLGIALNMGNETNMQRVLEGEGWTPEQVQAILKPLTREHWQFVQGVWDLINSYWPEISAKERRLSGVVPEKVQAREFIATAADGTQITMAGGYYPIKYNPARSSKAEADSAAEVLKQMERGLYARAQTARGHLEARMKSVGRPMRYDLGVIDQHLNQVIHDLSWHEYLIDANRLLNADSIDAAVREHYGPEVLKVMKKTLEDIAIGELPTQGFIERGVRYARSGVSIASMGWNLATAALQPLGLTQSMVRIGPKWVAKGMGRWLRDASSMESTVQWVGEKSEFMRLRAKTMQREINEIRNTINKGETMSAVEGSFFYLIGKLQLVADIPTWVGMYEKAMAAGNNEDRAIALADQAVLDSQGGGQLKDLSMVQRGGEWQKLWTNFYSYFNVTYQLMAESVGETQKVGASRLPLLAVDFLMLTVVPATLGFFLKAALKGTLGDDDEDKLIKKLAAENVSYLMGMMIGLREMNAAVSGAMGYEGPAGARFFADVAKFGKQVGQGEADEAFWRSANELGGVLLHYPALQIDRTVRGFIELSEGGENPLAPLFGPKPKN